MKALGLKANIEEVRKLIEEVDADNSGSIDFDEFKTMMTIKMVIFFSLTNISYIFKAQKEKSRRRID